MIAVLALGGLAAAGCSVDSVAMTAPPETTTQVMLENYQWSKPGAVILLIVVDDEASEQGRAVRALLAERFLATFDVGAGPSWRSFDPAAWTPYERYAIVVSPTNGAVASPVSNGALAVSAPRTTAAAVDSWKSAVAEAIVGAEATDQQAFRALEEQARWLRVLIGYESPDNDVERAVLAGLPARGNIAIVVGSGRDDESPLEPDAYLKGPENSDRIGLGWRQAITPDPTFVYCGPGRTPRLDEWARSGDSRGTPCADHHVFDFLDVAACFPRCESFRPLVDELGKAKCRVHVMTDLAPCDSALGWADPFGPDGTRAPREVEYEGGPVRLCEVMELDGPALDSCRYDWECPDCGAGYCVTTLPAPDSDCNGMVNLWPLRFTHGALEARTAIVDVVCDVEHVVE